MQMIWPSKGSDTLCHDLTLRPQQFPNASDVTYLQKKVTQSFIEEISLAQNTPPGIHPLPNSGPPQGPAQIEGNAFPEGQSAPDRRGDKAPSLTETTNLPVKLSISSSSGTISPSAATSLALKSDRHSLSYRFCRTGRKNHRGQQQMPPRPRITLQYARGKEAFVHTKWCADCKCHVNATNLSTHLKGDKHRLNTKGVNDPSTSNMRGNERAAVATPREESEFVNVIHRRESALEGHPRWCPDCERHISARHFDKHHESEYHRLNAKRVDGPPIAGRGPPTSGVFRDKKAKKVTQRGGAEDDTVSLRRTEDVAGETQWCAECECLINVNFFPNLAAHVRRQKHQLNVKRKATKDAHCHEPTSQPLIEPEQRPRAPLKKRGFEVPHSTFVQPRKKTLRGPYETSLAASFATEDPQVTRPHQDLRKRGTVDRIDRLNLRHRNHVLQHVDFNHEEHRIIEGATVKHDGNVNIKGSLDNLYSDPDSILMRRDPQAIKAQIQSEEEPQAKPSFTVIESRIRDPNLRPTRQIGSLLRHRELGSTATGRRVETKSELRIRMAEDIRPWRSFAGASHDVVAVAWAPDSIAFAAGAVAHSNPEDLQYNRPCNLLLGDLSKNTVTELPDHRIDRKKPEVGPNASQDMYNTCDPKVYKTVTAVKFHSQGGQMYSASEDHTVKIWDITKGTSPTCVRTLKHNARVTGLDVSPVNAGMLATASATIKDAIRVFRGNGEDPPALFSSSRAEMKPEWKIHPETLHWGASGSTSHLLLAGFQEYGRDMDRDHQGHLCLWDANTGQDLKVTPASQAIHTATWHPTLPYFASGGAPGGLITDRPQHKDCHPGLGLPLH